jgi:hypothetical protein
MCTVCGAKGIIDVDVGKHRQLLCKVRIILSFSGMEAQVLQQKHVSRPHRLDCLFHCIPNAVVRLDHCGLEQFRQPLGNR